MLQKIVVGLLTLTVVGAGSVGVYDAVQQNNVESAQQVMAQDTNADELAAAVTTDTTANTANQVQDGSTNGTLPQSGTPVAPAGNGNGAGNGATDGTGPIQQQQSLDMVGDPWTATGTITELTAVGMTLTLNDGSTVYVELGQPSFWQSQGVTLAVGDVVTVDGFNNGTQIHAATVTLADGSQIIVRSETGQPLWSGGATQQQGANGNGNAGTAAGVGQEQVAAEDWITLNGVVTAADASTLTMQTDAGEIVAMQLGTPTFWQSQGVTFAIGDEISVLGFWQGTQFQAGDITKVATGERIMLRDPNGRPLWAGPGRSGQGGQGATGQTAGQGQGQGTQGGQGQGAQGGGRGGNGRGYRGGRS